MKRAADNQKTLAALGALLSTVRVYKTERYQAQPRNFRIECDPPLRILHDGRDATGSPIL